MKNTLKVLFILIFFAACKDTTNSENQSNSGSAVIPSPAILSYTVLNVYPHDTNSFTEGLIWHNGSFLESTGEYKTSYLLKANLQTGKREKTLKLADQYFGEGIAVLNNKIYQLTYREHKVFIYDMNGLMKAGE
jgi:glutamine cyclotransferase